MIQVPIVNIPNQSFSITYAKNEYDVAINACRDNGQPGTGIVAVTLHINDVLVVSGVRSVAGFPILPSKYLENGNFIFVTNNDEYPDWRQFGITQYLVLASQVELEALGA